MDSDALRNLFNGGSTIIDPELLEAIAAGQLHTVIKNPAPNVYCFPLFSRQYCESLIEIAEATGRFASVGATYAAPELRLTNISPLIMDVYVEVFKRFCAPVIQGIWGLADHFDVLRVPFILRYSMDTHQSMGRHYDAHANLTMTINLSDGYTGGGVYFNAYDYNTRDVPVGHATFFPSMMTHEHEALAITDGVRVVMTCWLSSTKSDVKADESWVITY